jgi:hypothetical protein
MGYSFDVLHGQLDENFGNFGDFCPEFFPDVHAHHDYPLIAWKCQMGPNFTVLSHFCILIAAMSNKYHIIP